MPDVETTFLAIGIFGKADLTYLTAQEAASGGLWFTQAGWTGQNLHSNGNYEVYRTILQFDFAGIPPSANITGATLKLFGTDSDPDIDFIFYIVEALLSDPVAYTDYANLQATDFGQFNTTGWNNTGFNIITFNAAGLVYLNAALQTNKVDIGIRSEEDINQSPVATANTEYVKYTGTFSGNAPVLTITYTLWPDAYPNTVAAPLAGKIDLATYGVINEYMTKFDLEISNVLDADGNIDLAVANWITWTGTSEKIAYDNGTSNVTFTTLETTSVITLDGDLSSVDITGTMNASAVDCTVGGDLGLGAGAYSGIKSKVTDNEVVFSGISAPSPDDDEADIYMDSTSGDFIIKTRDDGQAGVKTDILGDFSAM